MVSCSAGLQTTLDLLATMQRAWVDSGPGMRRGIGRIPMDLTVLQGEPCRIMACVSGREVLALAVHAVGSNGQRPR